MTQSVSEVLNLQRLLSGSDVMDLIDAFSEAEWEVNENDNSQEGDGCEDSLDSYIPYFCGSLRNTTSKALKAILKRSCYGDSYQQGWCGEVAVNAVIVCMILCQLTVSEERMKTAPHHLNLPKIP